MQTFSKEEKLCGKKKIDQLFEKGEKFNEGSFTIMWEFFHREHQIFETLYFLRI